MQIYFLLIIKNYKNKLQVNLFSSKYFQIKILDKFKKILKIKNLVKTYINLIFKKLNN